MTTLQFNKECKKDDVQGLQRVQNHSLPDVNKDFESKCNAEINFSVTLFLAQANNFSIYKINVVGLWILWQTWHTDDITGNGNNHLGAGIENHVTYL